MHPVPLASVLDAAADAVRVTTDTATWSAEECDLVLRGLNTVAYEVVGLSARIRAARAAAPRRVNDTKPNNPVKPLKPEDPPPPPPEDPPSTPSEGRAW